MAKADCAHCAGIGMLTVHKTAQKPCQCVFRNIFRTVYKRFKSCAQSSGMANAIDYERCSTGKESRRSYGRKTEDFLADFILVTERTLNPVEYKLFRIHFMLGGDWKLCCARLKMERGNFFHAVYRIESKLGRVFAELTPYALYPLDEYFGAVIVKTEPLPVVPPPTNRALRAPLRQVLELVADVLPDSDEDQGDLQQAA